MNPKHCTSRDGMRTAVQVSQGELPPYVRTLRSPVVELARPPTAKQNRTDDAYGRLHCMDRGPHRDAIPVDRDNLKSQHPSNFHCRCYSDDHPCRKQRFHSDSVHWLL